MGAPESREISASFQNPEGRKQATVFVKTSVLINIQVLECLSGNPIRNAQVNYLAIGDSQYVKDGKIQKVEIGKQKDYLKAVGYFLNELINDSSKTAYSLFTTDNGGYIRIPVPLSKFEKDLEIKIGLRNLPVLAESFSTGPSAARERPYGSTEFSIYWSADHNYKQPDPTSESDKSWGWSVMTKAEKSRKNKAVDPNTVVSREMIQPFVLGNPPVTSPTSFKWVETFKIKKAPFDKVHPDFYFYDQSSPGKPYSLKKIHELRDWKRQNFNKFSSDFAFVAGLFSFMTHYVLFAMASAGKGMDVSSNNTLPKKPDGWKKIKESGIEFVYIRTSVGIGTHDSKAALWATLAKGAGIKIGYYYVPNPRNPNNSPILEAQEFIKVMSKLPDADLPPTLDLEEVDPGNESGWDPFKPGIHGWSDEAAPHNIQNLVTSTTAKNKRTYYEVWLTALMSYFTIDGHRLPVIYSFPSWLSDHLPADHKIDKYPLWIANPAIGQTGATNDPAEQAENEKKLKSILPGVNWRNHTLKPIMPKHGWKMKEWSIWQISWHGGIEGLSVNNTDKDFYKLEELYNDLPCPQWKDFNQKLPKNLRLPTT